MSVYGPDSLHRRQLSTSSVATTGTNFSFPASRSTTVSSTTSTSSRFSPTRKHAPSLESAAEMPMISSYAQNDRDGSPRPVTPGSRPGSSAGLPCHSPRASMHARGMSVPNFGPPGSPPYLSASSTPHSGTTPSPYVGANRHSVISGTSTVQKSDLESMKRSSTSHFRTLSKLSSEGTSGEFGIDTGQDVVGMHGRKRLQRAQTDGMSSWDRMTWMDKRRQYMKAYEYLCHIGEAKEWMEECMGEPIPPIVELEEALRDGVTLAKLAKVFAPELVPRIFEAPKLGYRHMDNINRFFKFLRKVELPEVFVFESTDLYNKKNIPKVIYCIHALSFYLFRLGLTEARIGSLVGQLQFTEDELLQTQKGLDLAGVSMPAFQGINKHFDEPEPEPVETEEERIDRELEENSHEIVRLQQCCRGALLRMRLSELMEGLWDNEEFIIELQARIRGTFSRVTFAYKADMAAWATEIQAAIRGHLVRERHARKQIRMARNENFTLILQAKIRGNKLRSHHDQQRKELENVDPGTARLQGAIRGLLLRRSLETKCNDIADSESFIVELQAAARGALLRRTLAAQVDSVIEGEDRLVDLQAAARGALLRLKMGSMFVQLQDEEDALAKLQGAIRGYLLRTANKADATALDGVQDSVADLGAAIRGVLVRQAIRRDLVALSQEEDNIVQLQSSILGFLVRQGISHDKKDLEELEDSEDSTLPALQGAIRGVLLRRAHQDDLSALEAQTESFTQLQALARATLLRWDHRQDILALAEAEYDVEDFQAVARGYLVRRSVGNTLQELQDNVNSVIAVQSRVRGCLQRWAREDTMDALDESLASIVATQAQCRGFIHRIQRRRFLLRLAEETDSVVALQSAIRGVLVRSDVDSQMLAVEDEEESIIELQSFCRGFLERARFTARLRHFKQNMEKVVKIQSFVRAKQQGEAYKSLMGGKNPPVGTVKNFVHLLNDSDFDFDEEIEFERLRKNMVQHVRANELAEQYVDQLDTKIALLVKNKITLDEVIKHQRHFGGGAGGFLSNAELTSADPLDLKGLNNNSKKRLERYQQMFYALQTQPQYLSKLFRKIREQNTADKDLKGIEMLIMPLFGYAQRRREEYYLLKLMVKSIREDLSTCEKPEDFLRGHFFWVRLLSHYVRSQLDRKFLRAVLRPLIEEEIVGNDSMDLESDPLQIYRSSINNEEQRTSRRSQRDPEVPRNVAINDPETRQKFISNLQTLRGLGDDFLSLLEDNLNRMPYGIRYIAQQAIEGLIDRFPDANKESLAHIVASFVFQKYFRPAILNPDKFGITDKKLGPNQKKNVGELAKLLGQIATGRLFGRETAIFLQPLNEYVTVAVARFKESFATVVRVPNLEDRYEMDTFDDLTSKQRPTLHIKTSDVFSIHRMIGQDIEYIAPNREDPLRGLIQALVSVQASETDLQKFGQTEMCLHLDPSFQRVEDPESEINALMVETKRCVLYIIRVQTGGNLMEILVKPITPEDLQRWDDLVQEEIEVQRSGGKKRVAYADHNALSDITSMTYAELKRSALENIIRLEKTGKITRKNQYQDILNAIATDIRTKHRRRVQRSREMDNVKSTLGHLNEKQSYLEQQLQSYNDYIEQAMSTLQTKKGRRKSIFLPFTKQYFHMRELQKSGKVPQFGSYKYSAKALAEKGVLVTLDGFPERKWSAVSFTLSSDEVGIFHVEASNGNMIIPGASAKVMLDDLLQLQFNNTQFLVLCDGMIKFNVNLFLHLLFRKFYRDE